VICLAARDIRYGPLEALRNMHRSPCLEIGICFCGRLHNWTQRARPTRLVGFYNVNVTKHVTNAVVFDLDETSVADLVNNYQDRPF